MTLEEMETELRRLGYGASNETGDEVEFWYKEGNGETVCVRLRPEEGGNWIVMAEAVASALQEWPEMLWMEETDRPLEVIFRRLTTRPVA